MSRTYEHVMLGFGLKLEDRIQLVAETATFHLCRSQIVAKGTAASVLLGPSLVRLLLPKVLCCVT